ncbi:uncharacterized protein K441DRAFT_358730 [Cenococcum geophilum 1.58]|uniref:Uncharacterized protein n=1 Tax=Cenococcum geophilum 1.58 TaxID=794803 RepID=A0ACC8EM47_9PEZI|nr:hypothetical protein K441DRAFT_358730 [Cenococcum geophilum 1.58]
MRFPNPKLRNIKKDINSIFPWSILSSALKKIISKYVSLALSPSLAAFSLRRLVVGKFDGLISDAGR